MYFDKNSTSLSSFGLNGFFSCSNYFLKNDVRAFRLSQYVAMSVTEVSDVDVDFTGAVLMLILTNNHSPIDLLVLIIVDRIDIGWS